MDRRFQFSESVSQSASQSDEVRELPGARDTSPQEQLSFFQRAIKKIGPVFHRDPPPELQSSPPVHQQDQRRSRSRSPRDSPPNYRDRDPLTSPIPSLQKAPMIPLRGPSLKIEISTLQKPSVAHLAPIKFDPEDEKFVSSTFDKIHREKNTRSYFEFALPHGLCPPLPAFNDKLSRKRTNSRCSHGPSAPHVNTVTGAHTVFSEVATAAHSNEDEVLQESSAALNEPHETNGQQEGLLVPAHNNQALQIDHRREDGTSFRHLGFCRYPKKGAFDRSRVSYITRSEEQVKRRIERSPFPATGSADYQYFTGHILITPYADAIFASNMLEWMPRQYERTRTHIFWTDGSVPKGRDERPAGAAAVWKTDGWSDHWFAVSNRTPLDTKSSNDAELFGIQLAMEEAIAHITKARQLDPHNMMDEVFILTDSQVGLKELLKKHPVPKYFPYFPGEYIAWIIYHCQTLRNMGVSVVLRWVPSHLGVFGNDLADQFAKDAAFKHLGMNEPGLFRSKKSKIMTSDLMKAQIRMFLLPPIPVDQGDQDRSVSGRQLGKKELVTVKFYQTVQLDFPPYVKARV